MSIEIQTGNEEVWGLAFRHDGKQIMGGNYSGGWFRRWQVEDGREAGTVPSPPKGPVLTAAASRDGRWIVHGDGHGVVVRNATTLQQVLRVREHSGRVDGVDVSPDSTQFASVSSDGTLRVFDIITGKRLLVPLRHGEWLTAVRFSPSGEYIATASSSSRAWVWSASTGSLLCEIDRSSVASWSHAPLAWSSDSKRLFFVTSEGKVTCHDVSTSNVVQEWLLLIDDPGHCSLATNGRFVACTTPISLSFWDTCSYSRIGFPVEVEGGIYGVTLSPDDSYFAAGGRGKIAVYALGSVLAQLGPGARLPLIQVSDAAFKPWTEGDLKTAEDRLSRDIGDRSHHALANRALVRIRMKKLDMAIEDAKKSLVIHPSPIAHIAYAVALLRKSEKRRALQVFDLSFCHCDANENRLILLIRAVFLFVSGERKDPVARVNDLIAASDESEKYSFYQVLGNMYRKQGDVQSANQSFVRAQAFSATRKILHLVTVSLIFGKDFDGLEIDM